MNQTEIAADRTLDPQELDINALTQADLYGKWAERAAAAKGEEDRLKFAAEVLEAKLQGEARRNPDKFNIANATETAIKSAVICHDEYVAAVDKYHAARLEAAMLSAAEKAMAQRKGMIEELVKLHGQQYFAGPSVPRDIISAWQAHRAYREEEVGNRLRGSVRRRVRVEGQK